MRLRFVDDIRALQSSPHNLLAEESTVRQRLGGGIDTRFFIVEGDNTEELLQHEENLRASLDPLVARHLQIGRASCRERVCQYVYISVVAVSLKKKIKTTIQAQLTSSNGNSNQAECSCSLRTILISPDKDQTNTHTTI